MTRVIDGKYYVSSTARATGSWATKNEYNVAIALMYYKIPFEFHKDILGGASVRGGFVIDFLVYNPFPTPLEVFGEYWHMGAMAAEDRLKLALLQSYYGSIPIIIWGQDSDTIELAKQAVRKEVV
jgi:hypothetical protein